MEVFDVPAWISSDNNTYKVETSLLALRRLSYLVEGLRQEVPNLL